MDKKILIVGHGLAGCTLALTFYRKNIPFKLIGCSQVGEASMASSGLIAPITGRRYVKAWRIDEFVPKALEFYRWTEGLTGGEFFFPVEIVRYLSHQEGRTAWERRLYDPEYAQYISDKKSAKLDALNRPYGIVTGGYRLDTPGWLNAVRGFLSEKGLLEIIDSPYPTDTPHEGIKIFATGAVDPSVAARVIPNKGESLLLKMPDWRIREVIKEEVFIMPLQDPEMCWVGSYYDPWPENPSPSQEGKERLLASIEKVYPGSIEIVKHMAGVRPTVNDRRPLIGPLGGRPGEYIFNGMGTKGTSLAPFWAEQLVAHITEDLPLPAEVLPDRYIP
ncbi:MAG TPA: FAD-dependent oxidoreductase [Saprospiraceae bacterium]|nr:FAD-dependent oxidoreductase [Saprospiraceae bacterium]